MQRTIEAAHEVRRELEVRRHVYPRLVANGKLSPEEAAERMRRMELALSSLLKLCGEPDVCDT